MSSDINTNADAKEPIKKKQKAGNPLLAILSAQRNFDENILKHVNLIKEFHASFMRDINRFNQKWEKSEITLNNCIDANERKELEIHGFGMFSLKESVTSILIEQLRLLREHSKIIPELSEYIQTLTIYIKYSQQCIQDIRDACPDIQKNPAQYIEVMISTAMLLENMLTDVGGRQVFILGEMTRLLEYYKRNMDNTIFRNSIQDYLKQDEILSAWLTGFIKLGATHEALDLVIKSLEKSEPQEKQTVQSTTPKK